MAQARPRRRRAADNQAVDGLSSMVNQLIKENRQLRRQVDKLSARATGATSMTVERALLALQRRLQRAVDGAATATTRRRTASAGAGRSGRGATTARVRKPVSPEVAEKRRAALEKARAARAAKRAAAANSE